MILNILYRNHVTNEKIRRNSNWREYEEFLTVAKKRYFTSRCLLYGLAEKILQGTMKGRRRGRRNERTILKSGQAQSGQAEKNRARLWDIK